MLCNIVFEHSAVPDIHLGVIKNAVLRVTPSAIQGCTCAPVMKSRYFHIAECKLAAFKIDSSGMLHNIGAVVFNTYKLSSACSVRKFNGHSPEIKDPCRSVHSTYSMTVKVKSDVRTVFVRYDIFAYILKQLYLNGLITFNSCLKSRIQCSILFSGPYDLSYCFRRIRCKSRCKVLCFLHALIVRIDHIAAYILELDTLSCMTFFVINIVYTAYIIIPCIIIIHAEVFHCSVIGLVTCLVIDPCTALQLEIVSSGACIVIVYTCIFKVGSSCPV